MRWTLFMACLLVLAACDTVRPHSDIEFFGTPVPLNATQFPATIEFSNPLFPLIPGTVKRFESDTVDGQVLMVVEVTDDKRAISGINATIVREQEWLNGERFEESEILYAQDVDGNVWYLGEVEWAIENGVIVAKEESWQTGQDGASAGIIMWAKPKLGSIYYQEYLPGIAEDVGEVLSLNEIVDVQYAVFQNCIMTREFSAIEPEEMEYKFFCPGIGHVLTTDGDTRLELTEVSTH